MMMVHLLFLPKRIGLILIFLNGLLNCNIAQTRIALEAESAELSGTAIIAGCNNSSGGQLVKNINGGMANSLTFRNISVRQAGTYFITVSYFSVSQSTISHQINSETAKVNSIPASGAWCYQGGKPAKYIFQEAFIAGSNDLLFYNSPIIDKIVISSDTIGRHPSAIYISSTTGDDDNDGFTPITAWKTLSKINSYSLLPGDSILFKAGDTFVGRLSIINQSGTNILPITFSNYGNGNLPVLDGNGYLSTIQISNSECLDFSHLEIINNGGLPQTGEPTNLRYGMFFENSNSDRSILRNYRLNDLVFRNIFPTENATYDDKSGVNSYAIYTSGSWGDIEQPVRFDNLLIENCYFTRTARHAIYFNAVNNLVIKDNLIEQVGGAGMVIGGNCSNVLVEGNTTKFTGSSIDNRMAGRGSGIWCYHTVNLKVQFNKFMYARGIMDSFGMHIDIGNRNVVYQYNYSEGNEGGFAEILGANVNVGYRYNLSVGDGWRKRGNQHGQVFWIAGWSGNAANPIGSDSIFIYNNSIFVRDTIAPGIWIENVTKHTRIYNNIICASNTFGNIVIKNDARLNDFDYNIWYGNIPVKDTDNENYRGLNSLISNPFFSAKNIIDSTGFILKSGSPAIHSGKLLYNPKITPPNDYFSNNGGRDYYGNEISTTTRPNIGAYNGGGNIVNLIREFDLSPSISIYPNPVKNGQRLVVEIPGSFDIQSVTINITDIYGKMKFNKIFHYKHTFQVQTEDLTRGYYLIEISAGNKYLTKKLMVF